MRIIIVLGILMIIGCGLFNPTKYNPNPRPVAPPVVEVLKDSVKVDTIKVIIIDTLKVK